MKIKELRKMKNVKSKQLAKVLKITPQSYSDKENGRRRFSAKEIKLLCEFFEISITDLDI